MLQDLSGYFLACKVELYALTLRCNLICLQRALKQSHTEDVTDKALRWMRLQCADAAKEDQFLLHTPVLSL